MEQTNINPDDFPKLRLAHRAMYYIARTMTCLFCYVLLPAASRTNQIIALLRHDIDRPERHLSFRSSSVVAATGAEPPAPAPMTHYSKAPCGPASSASAESNCNMTHPRSNINITSTGGSTQPATPSPGSNKLRPAASENNDGFPEEGPVHSFTGKGEKQQQKNQRLGSAMSVLGVGGLRAGAADAATMVGGPRASMVPGSGRSGVSFGEDDDGMWWRGAQQIELEENPGGGDAIRAEYSNPDGSIASAADAAVGGSRVTQEEPYSSQGVTQLFLEGGPQTINGRQSASNIGGAHFPVSPLSNFAKGDGDRHRHDDDPAAASAVGSGSPLTAGMAGNDGRQRPVDSINTSTTAIHAAAVASDIYQGALPADEEVASPQKYPQPVAGSSGTSRGDPGLVSSERHHQPPRHASRVVSSKAPATTLPAFSRSPFATRVPTGTTVLYGGEPERAHAGARGNIYDRDGGRIPRGDTPETVGHSLETVSLLSEPASYGPSVQRMSMLASLWGGGGGGQAGGAVTVTGAGADSASSVSREGEVEGARRLARSLAVKLKERARRCDELEDLFGLRDHQVW